MPGPDDGHYVLCSRHGAHEVTSQGIDCDPLTDYQRQLLNLSDERDTWERHALQMWQWGFEAGLRQGSMMPSMAEQLDFDPPDETPFNRVDPVVDCLRYPPHGRKRFGEPRPGDFKGLASD